MRDASATGWTIEVGDADFEIEVLERSDSTPVIVDFWAEWCGPCRALGPLLEKLVREQNGAVVLAKVNVDEAQQLAGYFQIDGIPAVRAFRSREMIDGFDGLVPEPALREFIMRILPSQTDQDLERAKNLEASDPAEAEALYRGILTTAADDQRAQLGLARVLIAAKKDEEAKKLLANLGVIDEIGQEAERLRRVLEVRGSESLGAGAADEAALRKKIEGDPENARLRYELGSVLATKEQYPEALELLYSAAERDKELAKNEVRELMVKIFQIIGVRSELSDNYRDKLRGLLY